LKLKRQAYDDAFKIFKSKNAEEGMTNCSLPKVQVK
jgi:hypothetical protein